MNRRNFIQTTGLSLTSLLINDSIFASPTPQTINFPDEVAAIINEQKVKLVSKGKDTWTYQDLLISLKNTEFGVAIAVQAPKVRLSAITLEWKFSTKNSTTILNDHWERTY